MYHLPLTCNVSGHMTAIHHLCEQPEVFLMKQTQLDPTTAIRFRAEKMPCAGVYQHHEAHLPQEGYLIMAATSHEEAFKDVAAGASLSIPQRTLLCMQIDVRFPAAKFL